MGKGKLVAGIVLTALAWAALIASMILLTVVGTHASIIMICYFIGLGAFVVFGFIGHLLIKSYRKNGGKGKLSMTFFIFSFMPYWVINAIVMIFLYIIGFIIKLIRGDSNLGSVGSSSNEKSVTVYTINDERGAQRELIEYDRYGGARHYKDDLGNLWLSKDEGKTFYRK